MWVMGLWQKGECVQPYKMMHSLVGGCITGYAGILRKALEILLFNEIVSLKKFPWLSKVGVRKSIQL